MTNTSLHKPVHFEQSDRMMAFTGDVIGEDQRESYTKLRINLDHICINNRVVKYNLPVDFYTRSQRTLLGKRVLIKGVIKTSHYMHKPNILTGTIDHITEQPIFLGKLVHGIRHYILRVFSSILDTRKSNLAKSLILGGSGRIGSGLKDIFSRAGILHILAVSGLHVGFVFAITGALLFFIPVSQRLKFAIIMLVLILYASVTGLRPSVCRATAMFFFFSLGLLIQRNVDRVHIINMIALIFLIFDPSLLFNISAQLSFAAVYGIFIVFPVLNDRIIERLRVRFSKVLVIPVAVSFSAQVFVVPLLIYYFHRIPTMAVITNFLIVPLASICVCSLFAMLFANIFSICCTQYIAFIVSGLFSLMIFIIRFFANLPFSTIAISISPVFLLLYYFLFSHKTRRWAVYGLLTVICLSTLARSQDCLVIRTAPFGTLVTIEQGDIFITDKCPTINTLRFLAQHQIKDLDYLIAPRPYHPAKKKFFKITDRFHSQQITLGNLSVRISRDLEIFYQNKQVHLWNFRTISRSTQKDVHYIITDGDRSYSFLAPYNRSILDQMTIDVKTMVYRIATVF